MLKKIQAATGIVFFAFLALHLTNTWLATFGAGVYDGVQSTLRLIYQAPVVEALVLAALLLHIAVGLYRRWREGPGSTALRARLHRYTGWGLALVIGGHVFAVRGTSWFYDIYPGFAGVAFSVDFAPWYFFPYYFLLATAGCYHGLNGLGIALNRLGFARALDTVTLRRATAVSASLTLAALLAFAGLWTETGDPRASEFGQLYIRIWNEITP